MDGLWHVREQFWYCLPQLAKGCVQHPASHLGYPVELSGARVDEGAHASQQLFNADSSSSKQVEARVAWRRVLLCNSRGSSVSPTMVHLCQSFGGQVALS